MSVKIIHFNASSLLILIRMKKVTEELDKPFCLKHHYCSPLRFLGTESVIEFRFACRLASFVFSTIQTQIKEEKNLKTNCLFLNQIFLKGGELWTRAHLFRQTLEHIWFISASFKLVHCFILKNTMKTPT